MIQSMTGFGRCQKTLGSRDITVEIKAVNQPVPGVFLPASPEPWFYRGQAQGAVQSQDRPGQGGGFGYRGRAERFGFPGHPQRGAGALLSGGAPGLCRKNGLTDDLALSDLCRIPELFTTRTAEVDEEALWRDISETADGA